MDAINVTNLTKSYDNVLAVNQITFSIAKGEVFGFLGPNGAGKTTTIRMLSGLLKPDTGKAIIAGYNVSKEPRNVKKQIGVVPEQSNLYNELSTWDNLIFMTQLYGLPREKRTKKVQELLNTFDLNEHRNKRFAKLSKGLKRRLTIGAALVHEPRILFLDEPTVGLDVKSARFIRQLLMSLKEEGVTIFLTSHYIEEVDLLCDRVAILDKGQIIVNETPEVLKKNTQSKTIVEIILKQGGDIFEKSLLTTNAGQIKRSNNSVRVVTDNITSLISQISKISIEHQLELLSVNTVKPTLEDAFVQITGLSLEKMNGKKWGNKNGFG